jgi:hypothetical protein
MALTNLERRMDKLERRLDATLNIVQTGMKMLVKMQQETREVRQECARCAHRRGDYRPFRITTTSSR